MSKSEVSLFFFVRSTWGAVGRNGLKVLWAQNSRFRFAKNRKKEKLWPNTYFFYYEFIWLSKQRQHHRPQPTTKNSQPISRRTKSEDLDFTNKRNGCQRVNFEIFFIWLSFGTLEFLNIPFLTPTLASGLCEDHRT